MYYEYQAKKLYKGFASVRDYVIKECIEKGLDLVINYKENKMGVPLEHLKNPHLYQIHRTKFKSKVNEGQIYELYDIFFVAGKNIKLK